MEILGWLERRVYDVVVLFFSQGGLGPRKLQNRFEVYFAPKISFPHPEPR
jgi:hypothetical protein